MLQSEQSQEQQTLSSPGASELAVWRVFLECALALPDVLGAEMEAAGGLSLRWYDVLVHLEEAGEGVPMNEVAGRILASKSGLTRVIDRMEKAGLVRRERIEDDRRVVLVHATDEGLAALRRSRRIHRDGIRRHFSEHLDAADQEALRAALEKVRAHVRPLRPGRVSGG
jgi:DNA-binding MarR family transcriptional regulator